jgi:hypothetical protein
MILKPATQAGNGIERISFTLSFLLSTEHRGGDRFRHFCHTEPIVAVDHDCFTPGDHLALEKKFDRFLHLAVEFNDRSTGEFQYLA